MKVGLKSSFNSVSAKHLRAQGHRLVLMISASLELLSFCGGIDPEASLTAYGTCAFDCEAHKIGRVCRGRQIDVATRNIWRAIAGQGKEVDFS